MLKKQIFLITLLYTIALTFVCLIRIKNIPNIGVSFGDKIFHSLAYIVLTFLWVNTFLYTFKIKKESALPYAALFCIVFGIVIEVLQGALTTYRSSDIYDVVANTSGVLIALLNLVIFKLVNIKK